MKEMSFRLGDPVIVNTGGQDAPATIMQKHRYLGLRCAFSNGTSQFIPVHYIRRG